MRATDLETRLERLLKQADENAAWEASVSTKITEEELISSIKTQQKKDKINHDKILAEWDKERASRV
jgi:hypothetical protein